MKKPLLHAQPDREVADRGRFRKGSSAVAWWYLSKRY